MEQVQGLLPTDLGLITNILSNPIHSSENVFIPSSPLQKKKQTKLIYCNVMCLIQAWLLQFVQPTSLLICNFSLKCLRLQIEHSPMPSIPNPNIMVEPTLRVTTRVEATNKGEGRL